MKNTHVVVLGDGGWGTALAILLSQTVSRVTVWGPFEEPLRTVREKRMNETYLPGVPIPESIVFTSCEESLRGAETAVLVVPSRFTASVCERFESILKETPYIVSAGKGLIAESDGFYRLTEVAGRIVARDDLAALSGPSHAEEVARGVPSAVTLAHPKADTAAHLREIFATDTFRTYSSTDVTGVELGGALKNIIAIAAGVSDGLGFGDNTKAALMTRGLAEIVRLGVAMGAEADTFQGLSGMGDLIVTCGSRHSRNRSVGERLGQGEKIRDILESMKQVAEGVHNCAAARDAAQSLNIEVPIIDQVCAIIHNEKSPREAVQELLSRDLKAE